MEFSTHDGLVYETWGSGPTVIALHGGLGLDHQYLRPMIENWTGFVRMVWYDHRGNGRSEVPDDWASVTLASLADDVDSIRQAVGVDRMFLYGHSYGGFIALGYALRYPERLHGLILASTAPHLGHPPNIPEDAPPAAIEAFVSIFEAPMSSDEQWARAWKSAFPLYAPELDPATAAHVTEQTVYRADAWNRAAALLADYDVSDQLAGIRTPTLLLSGARDFITGLAAHEELHAGIPNSELVVFDNAGHFPFLSDPAGYRSAAEHWIRRQPGFSDTP